MNIFDLIKQQINIITQNLYSIVVNQSSLSVELPREKSHGDISTNIAMLLAKQIDQNPKVIAQQISEELSKLEYINSVNIAGPGFINICLKSVAWEKILSSIHELGFEYGDNNIGKGEPINIEFVSCNPTGPMHIGHSRGAIYGDALANLMKKCGYEVCKEFYINDAGSQIDVLAQSAYLRYLQVSGENIEEIPAGLYPGEYLIAVGEKLFDEYSHSLKEMNEKERVQIVKTISINEMMKSIKKDLQDLGVEHDVFFSEKTLHDEKKIDELVEQLKERGIIYRGVLPPPKGKMPEDWEPREQLLIKTTEFGDDVDRSIQKSNGDWTYAAADIAYMKNKIDRGFKKITMVLGVDHLGYKKRMQATAYALAGDEVEFQIKFCQIVNFFHNGQPFKMSKRKGTFITVEDVVNEVGKDIVRFVMLTRRNDQILDFDLDKVKEQSKDNPVFYVQYANARINSILNNASTLSQEFETKIGKCNYSLLEREEEIELIKILALWPKVVELSCLHQEPHRIAFYLIELASIFHSFWSKGNEDPTLRFIIKDNFELSLARLSLAKAVSIIIESALEIFNVKPVKKM